MRHGIFFGASLLCAVPALLAADKLNIRTGLWEVTSVTTITGMPPLPKDVLDKMTPESRAEMEAAMKAEAAKGPQTDTDRECITQKDIEHPFESADDENCTQTIVSTSSTSQEVRLVCNQGEHRGTGTFKVNTPTPTTMTGVLDLRAGDGKNPMVIKSQMKGHWLSADCGDEADDDHEDDDEDDDSKDE